MLFLAGTRALDHHVNRGELDEGGSKTDQNEAAKSDNRGGRGMGASQPRTDGKSLPIWGALNIPTSCSFSRQYLPCRAAVDCEFVTAEMIIKGSVLLPRFISRPPKKSLSDSRTTDSASASDTDHKWFGLQLKIFYLSLSAKLFMIRPIASLEQRRRKRIHHNILSGVVDRAELIRGRPKAAIDSIRGGNEGWTDGYGGQV